MTDAQELYKQKEPSVLAIPEHLLAILASHIGDAFIEDQILFLFFDRRGLTMDQAQKHVMDIRRAERAYKKKQIGLALKRLDRRN